jgi:hypothetical protein
MPDLPDERTKVELPLIAQFRGMGWRHIESDTEVPAFTERESFRDVLLVRRLRAALRRINREDGRPWLDDSRIAEALGALERLGASRLMEANGIATNLLLRGTTVDGDPILHSGREQTVRYIDFEHPRAQRLPRRQSVPRGPARRPGLHHPRHRPLRQRYPPGRGRVQEPGGDEQRTASAVATRPAALRTATAYPAGLIRSAALCSSAATVASHSSASSFLSWPNFRAPR